MQSAFLPTSLTYYEGLRAEQTFTLHLSSVFNLLERQVISRTPNVIKDVTALLLSNPDKLLKN